MHILLVILWIGARLALALFPYLWPSPEYGSAIGSVGLTSVAFVSPGGYEGQTEWIKLSDGHWGKYANGVQTDDWDEVSGILQSRDLQGNWYISGRRDPVPVKPDPPPEPLVKPKANPVVIPAQPVKPPEYWPWVLIAAVLAGGYYYARR